MKKKSNESLVYLGKYTIGYWFYFQTTFLILKIANLIDWDWKIILLPTICAALYWIGVFIAAMIVIIFTKDK